MWEGSKSAQIVKTVKKLKANFFFFCIFQVKVNVGKCKEKVDVAVSPNEATADIAEY